MPNLKLLNGNNQEAVYENVETIKVPTEDGSTQIYETYKERQTKTVSLSMSEGNQTITPDENMLLTSVTIEKPADLIPENIKEGADIGGVIGTLVIESSSDTTTETTTLTRPTASTLSIDSMNGTINVAYSNSVDPPDKVWAIESLCFNNDNLLASNVLAQIDAEFQLMLLQYMFYRDIKKNGIDSGNIEETNEAYQAYKKEVYMFTSSMMAEFGANYGLAKRCDTALGNVPIDDFISGMFLNFNLNTMFAAGATTPTFEYTDLGRLFWNYIFGVKNKYEMRHGYSELEKLLSEDSNALIVKCSMLSPPDPSSQTLPQYISITDPNTNVTIGKSVTTTASTSDLISDSYITIEDTLYTSDKNVFKITLDSTDFNIYKFNQEFVINNENYGYGLYPMITTKVEYTYDSENSLLFLEDDGDDNCGMYIMSNLNLLKKPTPSISIDESNNISIAVADASDIDSSTRNICMLHNNKPIATIPYSVFVKEGGTFVLPGDDLLEGCFIDITDGNEHIFEVYELPVDYSPLDNTLDESTYWVASDKATLII